jgi:hypothetical protein
MCQLLMMLQFYTAPWSKSMDSEHQQRAFRVRLLGFDNIQNPCTAISSPMWDLLRMWKAQVLQWIGIYKDRNCEIEIGLNSLQFTNCNLWILQYWSISGLALLKKTVIHLLLVRCSWISTSRFITTRLARGIDKNQSAGRITSLAVSLRARYKFVKTLWKYVLVRS